MAEHHFLASYNAPLSNAAWPEAADFALDGDRIGRFDPARQWPQLFEKPACPCCVDAKTMRFVMVLRHLTFHLKYKALICFQLRLLKVHEIPT